MADESPSWVVSTPPAGTSSFDERDLVERARTDADAFAELYRRHVDRIHAFARRRSGSRDVAEEITSATFERALRGINRFRWRSGGIAPWLYRIAANELADHYRRQARRQGSRARRGVAALHDQAAHDDLDRIDDSDRLVELRSALDELNPRYQRALTLRYLAGLDHAEAAAAMGLSPSVMAVLVHRATAALRRRLAAMETTTDPHPLPETTER
ncbi:MAG: RNA polymerase sigma factor [Acidimicrobiales bacterium]